MNMFPIIRSTFNVGGIVLYSQYSPIHSGSCIDLLRRALLLCPLFPPGVHTVHTAHACFNDLGAWRALRLLLPPSTGTSCIVPSPEFAIDYPRRTTGSTSGGTKHTRPSWCSPCSAVPCHATADWVRMKRNWEYKAKTKETIIPLIYNPANV